MKYWIWGVLLLLGLPMSARAESVIDITFPVEGAVQFANTFTAARSNGRVHNATDIMAAKMLPVLATVNGTILFAPMVQPSYGFMIMLGGDDGYQYNYVHLNNDTPGTDDGLGGPQHAYAEGIKKGVRVKRGQRIGYVGDSGNAERTAPHLHFEIYRGRTAVNPYAALVVAQQVESTKTLSTADVSVNHQEAVEGIGTCVPGDMIRTESDPDVYFCGHDGGRYLFPTEIIFLSWNANFNEVKIVSDQLMDSLSKNGNIGARS